MVMRIFCRRLCFVHLIVLLFPLMSQAQSLPNKNERLFHVGRVWGYIKYFHPGAAGCTNNMDSALLAAIKVVDTATSYDSFEQGLLYLFEQAGPIVIATDPEIDVDTLYKLNLDLRWHHDVALPLSVRSKLDSIRVNFRPFDNCYFKRGENTTVYYIEEKDYTPSVATKAPYPLLLLFRAWNIHNYFSPYRRLIEPSWDSALVDLIPYFERVSSALELHLAFTRYQAEQLDAHSFTGSSVLTNYYGSRYLPCIFTLVEGKTVVTEVFSGVEDLRVGDIILSIDGTPVQAIRDSLRPYTAGGAREIVDRNISINLLRGRALICTLEVENTDGIRSVVLQRTSHMAQVADSLYGPQGDGMAWKILPGNIGYVNVGMLTVATVADMYEDLRSTKALIFDVRNYPGEFVIYDVANLLLPSRRVFCNFYFPDPTYPGTFEDRDLYCGPNSNPDYYQGEVRILQNEITQSQAEFTIMAWQTHPKAKIIGSQTAGADGNVSSLTFPTALTLSYSGCGVLYPDREETQIVGIEEDITVTPTINGIREGRDEVLEAALASLSVQKVAQDVQLDFSATVNREGTLTLMLPPSLDRGTLTIYDLVGRRVFHQANSEVTIDISYLPSGVYLLELASQGEIRRTRVRKGL